MSEMLEDFWTEVLSNEPDRVRSALADVTAADRESVMRHLQRMASEPGWSDGQRGRAQAALDALQGSSGRD